ncbi:MAG: hypothetical protein IPJ71_17135 [Bdellovibrionales bacterium]|nr:hypothetical protein [Bdellovibrionales bacterium]
MLKSAVCIFLTFSFVFCSIYSSAYQKKVHILIGDVEGAKKSHFDNMEMISFWFRERHIGVVTHFSAVESDLEEVLRHYSTVGVVWIGHSDPLGGVLGADGRKIPKSSFFDISPSVATIMFISCCAESVVLPHYRIRESRPEIDLLFFNAPETGGVIYFQKHMKAFFGRERLWSELLSSIENHQWRSPSCRETINEF